MTKKTTKASAKPVKKSPETTDFGVPLPWAAVFVGIFVLVGLLAVYSSDDNVTRVSDEAYVDERPTQSLNSIESDGPRIRIINE